MKKILTTKECNLTYPNQNTTAAPFRQKPELQPLKFMLQQTLISQLKRNTLKVFFRLVKSDLESFAFIAKGLSLLSIKCSCYFLDSSSLYIGMRPQTKNITFGLDYENHGIEFEYDIRISYQWCFQSSCSLYFLYVGGYCMEWDGYVMKNRTHTRVQFLSLLIWSDQPTGRIISWISVVKRLSDILPYLNVCFLQSQLSLFYFAKNLTNPSPKKKLSC